MTLIAAIRAAAAKAHFVRFADLDVACSEGPLRGLSELSLPLRQCLLSEKLSRSPIGPRSGQGYCAFSQSLIAAV